MPENPSCNICIKAKGTRSPFPESITITIRPLELVYSDVYSPLKPPTLDGHRYILIITDDFSRKIFVFPLSRKSEVFISIKN